MQLFLWGVGSSAGDCWPDLNRANPLIRQLVVSMSTNAAGPSSQDAASEGVSQLIVQLPQAKSATEVFGVFADKVHSIFEGLQHISLLLLPAKALSSNTSCQPPAPTSSTQGKGSSTKGTNKASGSQNSNAGKNAGGQGTSDASTEVNSKMQTFRAGCGLDWSNCCVFNLYPGRGPVVQTPPSWPVTCTATCYAAVTVQDVVTTGGYAAEGPHFLDWKALAEHGNVSMAAVPMHSCNKPVAVLCLASKQADAFSSVTTLRLLGGLLAPYCSMLTYSTRLTEMRRLVNDLIAPIAASLAQQKSSQLAKLGCTVEEALPGSMPADGKGICVAVGSQGRNCISQPVEALQGSQADASTGASSGTNAVVTQPVPVAAISSSGPLKQRKGVGSKGGDSAAANGGKGSSKAGAGSAVASAAQSSTAHAQSRALSHKRFESVIVKGSGYESDCFGGSLDSDLDWGDFFFNLVSMVIVYVYFSKTAAAGESMVAIMLCMGVAGLDILVMAMRWLWYDQYIAYGNMLMTFLQAYRVVVLPVANTWMSWSLLHKMSITPSGPLIVLLGIVLLACIIMGLQVRFFLHAPLQLASVLFAAMSTPEICGAFFESTSNIRCVGIITALQLSLGLLLPSICLHFLEGRPGRAFLPHMQAKRWLMNPV